MFSDVLIILSWLGTLGIYLAIGLMIAAAVADDVEDSLHLGLITLFWPIVSVGFALFYIPILLGNLAVSLSDKMERTKGEEEKSSSVKITITQGGS